MKKPSRKETKMRNGSQPINDKSMKRILLFLVMATAFVASTTAADIYKPWKNGRLKISDNHLYLIHENGQPFFWMGNTAWLLPERLNRDEVEFFLTHEREEGYNVEQIQVLNAIPTYNVFGAQANNERFDFEPYTRPDNYGYWDHLDYIVTSIFSTAALSGGFFSRRFKKQSTCSCPPWAKIST